MKTRRQKASLKIAIICFTIAALALIGFALEVSNCYAGQDTTSPMAKKAFYIQGADDGSLSLYTRIKNPKGLVVLYGVAKVTVNGKPLAKSKYITHSHKFLFDQRPVEQLQAGSMNPLFPVWLTFMKATTPKATGKVVTLVKAKPGQQVKMVGYIKVMTVEEWAICKRMRAAWEQQKKANAAKGQ